MKKPISREEALQILSKHDVEKIEMYKDGITYNLKPIQRTCLNTLRDAIYEDAVAHGLWKDFTSPVECVDLILDEVFELDSAVKSIRMSNHGAVQEFCEELADVIIASLSVAGKMGIDIDAAVRRKMEINKARPWKHGKEEQ